MEVKDCQGREAKMELLVLAFLAFIAVQAEEVSSRQTVLLVFGRLKTISDNFTTSAVSDYTQSQY